MGHTGGRLVRHFRPTVDPEAWAEAASAAASITPMPEIGKAVSGNANRCAVMMSAASMVEAGGAEVTEPVIAGLIIWRLFTVVVVFILGLGALGLWRRSQAVEKASKDVEPA